MKKLLFALLLTVTLPSHAGHFTWRYNPAGAPASIGVAQVETAIKRGISDWAACGQSQSYAGQTSQTEPGYGEVILKWDSTMGMYHAGMTTMNHKASATRLTSSAVSLSTEYIGYHPDAVHIVIIHEMGHVLGIRHHDQFRPSIMHQAHYADQTVLDSDIARCKREVPINSR
jgi:hypothetical protein